MPEKPIYAGIAALMLVSAASASPIPVLPATSATANWENFGTSLDLAGPGFTLGGTWDSREFDTWRPGQPLDNRDFSVGDSRGAPTFATGTVTIDGITQPVVYAGSLGVFYTPPLVPFSPNPVLQAPAMLTGFFGAFTCIPPPCFFPPCDDPCPNPVGVADIPVNLRGTFTMHLSGPDQDGLDVFDYARFTSIPEPSSMLLGLSGLALLPLWLASRQRHPHLLRKQRRHVRRLNES
jgi:hypothetical protein